MADAALKFGFGTPFQEQLDFLRAKLALPTQQWDDIQRAAHDRAFVVAGAAQAALLADLQNAVIKAAAEGKGLAEFRKDFKSIVQKHGWTGWTGEGTKAGEAWRTRVIYQTNMATSYAAGRYQQLTEPAFLKLHPYWRYIHREGAINPRPQHLAWHGLTLRHDHAFWATHFAPNGWGCGCRITPVTQSEGRRSANAGLDEPPAGWDKPDPQTGAPVGIDKGFDYAPGQNSTAWAKQLMDPKIKALFGSTTPIAIQYGNDRYVMQKVLHHISTKLPNTRPFSDYEIDPSMQPHLLRTDGDGHYAFSAEIDQFLRSAFRSIRHGQALTIGEEDAIQGLWHEIGHNRQKYLLSSLHKYDGANNINTKVMEGVNDLIAHHTYPQFLHMMGGGKALHSKTLWSKMANQWTRNVNTVLDTFVSDDSLHLPLLEKINFEMPLDESENANILNHLTDGVLKFAASTHPKLTRQDVMTLLSAIDQDPSVFRATVKTRLTNVQTRQ